VTTFVDVIDNMERRAVSLRELRFLSTNRPMWLHLGNHTTYTQNRKRLIGLLG